MSELTRGELASALEMAVAWLMTDPTAKVEIEQDYYWNLPRDVRFNIDVPPTPSELTIGQLSSDCEAIKSLLTGEHEFMAVDLEAIASISSAIRR